MGYSNYLVDLKQACLLDTYTIAFHWAQQQGFDARQLSGFITLLSSMLTNIQGIYKLNLNPILDWERIPPLPLPLLLL